jgi:hypothetical protein
LGIYEKEVLISYQLSAISYQLLDKELIADCLINERKAAYGLSLLPTAAFCLLAQKNRKE